MHVYSKYVSSQCILTSQIEPGLDQTYSYSQFILKRLDRRLTIRTRKYRFCYEYEFNIMLDMTFIQKISFIVHMYRYLLFKKYSKLTRYNQVFSGKSGFLHQ
jgi:hypothetical protein